MKLLQQAREQGYRVILHYVMIDSPNQAVERVKIRVLTGGHHVPENASPPPVMIAEDNSHSTQKICDMITSTKLQETNPVIPSNTSEIVLEAGRVATEKMLHLYERMGIKVTPQMTLAPDSPPPSFQPFALW